MESPTSFFRPETITADAGTIINLNATGRAREIIQAIRSRFIVLDQVREELNAGRRSGRHDGALLDGLLADQLFELAHLNADAMIHFEDLAIGSAISTLDDGEAASIAYSVTAGVTVAIDERKATALCYQRYISLSVCSTVDILKHPNVQTSLGKEDLSAAVFRALIHGHMRVHPRNLKWVVDLIGPEQASACSSLPRIARRPRAK